jgi:hypothetical protein
VTGRALPTSKRSRLTSVMTVESWLAFEANDLYAKGAVPPEFAPENEPVTRGDLVQFERDLKQVLVNLATDGSTSHRKETQQTRPDVPPPKD